MDLTEVEESAGEVTLSLQFSPFIQQLHRLDYPSRY